MNKIWQLLIAYVKIQVWIFHNPTEDIPTDTIYLYGIDRIANGAWRGQDNRQGLVFLEAVRQQTVDGAVVIVDVRL